MNISRKNLSSLLKIYKDFRRSLELSAKEFVNDLELTDRDLELFYQISKHSNLLKVLTAHFLDSVHNPDPITAEFILFCLIFILSSETLNEIFHFSLEIKWLYLCDLITCLVDVNRHLFICQTCCNYFDDTYVLNTIMDPFLNRLPFILQLGQLYYKRFEVKSAPRTKPKVFSFMADVFYKKSPQPPCNTPAIKKSFKARKLPETTWKKDKIFDRKITKLKKENRSRAEELIKEASKVRADLVQPKSVVDKDDLKHPEFKSKPPPMFKPVEVKGNLTTTLREASRLVKHQEYELKKVDELIKGGGSLEGFEKLEEELRKENELKQLELIEKNHLKGLLSHEEAVLAKLKLQEVIKLKKQKFKEEKMQILQALCLWREQEEEKIKVLVEKSHMIKQNARESEKKLLEKKQEKVKRQQNELKDLLHRAFLEKKRELTKKIELIQEIKAIHRVRCDIVFDPTETPNLGLLCEMSIAELQERLVLMKMKMQQELQEKRQKILTRKQEHRRMIENVNKFIEEHRGALKMKKRKKEKGIKMEQSEDLLKLKRLLDEKKKQRIHFQEF